MKTPKFRAATAFFMMVLLALIVVMIGCNDSGSSSDSKISHFESDEVPTA